MHLQPPKITSTFVAHKGHMLDSLITSKTRLRLLVKFFINEANQGHMRGLAEEFNESTNAIRKELNNLSEAGYLQKRTVQNRIAYRANTKHPLFASLQNIVHKYLGLDTIVSRILDRMGDVQQVVLIGDYAAGRDTGTIEIVIVGQTLDEVYLEQLAAKIEETIGRCIQFTLLEKPLKKGLVLYQEIGQK